MIRKFVATLALCGIALVGCASTELQPLATPQQGLAVLHEQHPETRAVPDEVVFTLVDAICNQMDSGMSFESTLAAVMSGGIEPDVTGAIVAMAFATECPAHLHHFDQ